ncbi:HAD family hydrolase [Cryobacterium tagatosivorans]|uniref:HAD family hydrolase n=1 Tax=Cryobacterium tagatosivorans TaxID=1259199 RepID=A0A4R8UF27_9MICO|nr:HAD family hydrolase [Cryobacterium tagatosivorans]TFB52337.1 HAD family hydrolase [Cryobacterium tagatosivorans]
MIPRLALFDLDDTLFAHSDAVAWGIERHLVSEGGAFAGADATASVTLWRSLEEEHYHSYLAGVLDYRGQRRARAQGFAAAHGVTLDDGAALAWFEGYLVHYRAGWRLHEDALPCLDTLALRFPGIRFGLITNGELAFQGEKLRETGLDERIEHVIASGSLGITKPDPRIFLHACSVFGVRPADAVYVGDRLRTDAIGAAAAGLTGVWLARPGTAPDPAAAAAAAAAAEASRLGVIRIPGLAALPDALAAHL